MNTAAALADEITDLLELDTDHQYDITVYDDWGEKWIVDVLPDGPAYLVTVEPYREAD